MASSESPRTVKVRGRRRASASSRVRTEAKRPGTMFCSNCGSALSEGAGGMPPAPAPVYMGTPGLASPMEAERHTQIGRTKTGLLLLLIGTLIRWIPYFLAGLLGGLLLL